MGKEHMCELADSKSGFKKMRKAARDARYICRSCGRSAADEERLCSPEPLYKKD